MIRSVWFNPAACGKTRGPLWFFDGVSDHKTLRGHSAKNAMSLADAAKRVQALCDAAKSVKPDILVLCHGGPISEPDDVSYILQHTTGIVGFIGASSIERLPTEVAITNCVKQFKGMELGCKP